MSKALRKALVNRFISLILTRLSSGFPHLEAFPLVYAGKLMAVAVEAIPNLCNISSWRLKVSDKDGHVLGYHTVRTSQLKQIKNLQQTEVDVVGRMNPAISVAAGWKKADKRKARYPVILRVQAGRFNSLGL